MQGGLGSSGRQKGGCAPPMAQAGWFGPDSRICVRRLHLFAGHHEKVPDRCPAYESSENVAYCHWADAAIFFLSAVRLAEENRIRAKSLI